MIPPSLRWRLPLSYAAIALLTTLALGAILLTTLRGFYRQQELNYLTGNAQAIGEELASLPANEFASGFLPAQAKGLAFLSQTRVEILNQDKSQLLADSGDPSLGDSNTLLTLNVEVDGVEQTFSQSVAQEGNQANTNYTSSIVIETGILSRNVEETVTLDSSDPSQTLLDTPGLISRLPVAGTPYGFGLNPESAAGSQRSDLVVEYPINSESNELLGYVQLSEGPAYGRDILRSVAWGWVIASTLAALLAAGVGWFISRRLTSPLLALTEVTRRMAGGDLSARATLDRRDELGILGRSVDKMAQRVQGTVITLRQFMADAAHELHTPLTALHTNLELLGQTTGQKQNGPTDEIRLERAKSQLLRLRDLTDSLLELSRIEADQADQEWLAVNLNELVQTSSELYASRAEQAGLVFEMTLPPETITVSGDATQLQQALNNLLDNSTKFTPQPGQIRISLYREDNLAVIAVADTGIGVPEADLPQLFSRFHRGRNTTDFPGSGLGLAIVKAIIEAHVGRVQVASSGPGQGCTFTLRLPLGAEALVE